MTSRINGAVSTALTQKRLVMSVSSGFSSPSSGAVIVRGSSAIPQMGQLPGASRTISGCIGQVYSTAPAPGAAGAVGGAAASDVNRAGSALNRSRQERLQKEYVRPAWAT